VSRSVEPAHFKGLGFDACTAPSVADLKAWAKSPFRAVNIYIGGVNRGCPQPQLSKSWVSSVTEMGWDLIPTFVGLQAPQNVCGCASIVPGKAYSEGVSSADDAISEMESLGIGPHNPIYFDMEPYTPGKTNTGNVRAFLEGWTTRLHAKHYLSGVYSGSYSGIFDLAARYGTSYREPDDIWFANYNGVPSATDTAIPAADWASNQRIHQYEGSHDASYGGVTINVDSNYCDGGVVSKSSL
jgi:hypothetical protein